MENKPSKEECEQVYRNASTLASLSQDDRRTELTRWLKNKSSSKAFIKKYIELHGNSN